MCCAVLLTILMAGQPLLPFCSPAHPRMSGLDGRHHFGPQGQGWQSRDNEAGTLGAVRKGREAGEPTPLLRHKNKTFMVFKPMHLWVFCQRQLKLILNIMTINGKKNVAPSSHLSFLWHSQPPCPKEDVSHHVET